MWAVTATQPFQGLRLLKMGRVFPRVAKAQPWAEFSQRFQRYIQTASVPANAGSYIWDIVSI